MARPKEFAAIRAQMAKAAAEESKKEAISVKFGNTHQTVAGAKTLRCGVTNSHEWTAFVRVMGKSYDSRDLVSKVVFGLHESFGVTEQTVRGAPF